MRISDWSSDVCSSDLAVADMETAERRDDRAAWAAGDATFHRLLVEASGNRRLVAMVEAVRDQSHRVRMLTLQLRPRPVNSNRDHAEVLQAIRDRGEETAYRVPRRHRLEAGRRLKIGRAAGRELGWRYVEITVVR